jgi:hypothetical protein
MKKKDSWIHINCREGKLSEVGQFVLIARANYTTGVGRRLGTAKNCQWKIDYANNYLEPTWITHWMPTPEPPERTGYKHPLNMLPDFEE